MNFIKQLYLNNFFFYLLIGIVALFGMAFVFPALYNATWYLLLILLVFLVIDILILFSNKK